MITPPPLNLTVPHAEDEPPMSFAARLARRNFRHARMFTRDFGLNINRLADGCSMAVAKLATLGAASYDSLMKCAFQNVAGVITLKGQRLSKFDLRRARVHICPQCLLDDIANSGLEPDLAIHARANWMLTSIKTCSVHNTALVEVARNIPAHDTHDWTMNVAPVIPDFPSLVDTVVVRKPSGFESYLLGRLDGETAGLWLDRLEFHVANHFTHVIGAVAAFGKQINLDTLTEKQHYEAGDAGFSIVKGGPVAIREFMEEMKRTHLSKKRASADGPQAVYGKLYTTLSQGLASTAYDAIREVMAEHIVDHFPFQSGAKLFGKPVIGQKQHSIRSASVTYGMHPKRLRKLIAAEGLLPDPSLLDRDVLVDVCVVERIFRREQNSISLKEAETYLNAGRIQTKCLWDAGIIKSHRVGIGRMNEVFLKSELDEFLNQLLQDAEPIGDHSEPIMDIREAARRACCPVVEVVRLILDRKLDWVGRKSDLTGFAAVLVNLDAVKTQVALPAPDGLPVQTTAKDALRTTPAVIASLIEIGALQTVMATNPINRCPVRIVPTAEINRFRATYVSLNELSRQRGLHMTVMNRSLKGQGILPAPELAGAKATFYRRDVL